jgi:thioredoxin-like negative regulator of GroEL
MSGPSRGETPAQSHVTNLASETEADTFVSKPDIALVEFYTGGCGICQSMEPVLSNIARELEIPVGTINPRDDPRLIDRFDVQSVPLFVLFVDGEPVARLAEGFLSGDDLTAWIEEHSA